MTQPTLEEVKQAVRDVVAIQSTLRKIEKSPSTTWLYSGHAKHYCGSARHELNSLQGELECMVGKLTMEQEQETKND